jgi:hypothetical protein
VLDEMVELPTGNGLHPTPLPNTNLPSTCHEVWIFGGTTEIQKEIIAHGLGLQA